MGTNSVAFGTGTINNDHPPDGNGGPGAFGTNSIATGNNTTAIADNSVTFGDSTTTSVNVFGGTGKNSIAYGLNTFTNNDQCLAGGDGTIATGTNSVALGYQTTAQGNQSIATGNNTAAAGPNSMTFGSYTVAVDNSLAGGQGLDTNPPTLVSANGKASVAIEYYDSTIYGTPRVSTDASTAFGRNNEVTYDTNYSTGVDSFVMGTQGIANMRSSFVHGGGASAGVLNSGFGVAGSHQYIRVPLFGQGVASLTNPLTLYIVDLAYTVNSYYITFPNNFQDMQAVVIFNVTGSDPTALPWISAVWGITRISGSYYVNGTGATLHAQNLVGSAIASGTSGFSILVRSTTANKQSFFGFAEIYAKFLIYYYIVYITYRYIE